MSLILASLKPPGMPLPALYYAALHPHTGLRTPSLQVSPWFCQETMVLYPSISYLIKHSFLGPYT